MQSCVMRRLRESEKVFLNREENLFQKDRSRSRTRRPGVLKTERTVVREYFKPRDNAVIECEMCF